MFSQYSQKVFFGEKSTEPNVPGPMPRQGYNPKDDPVCKMISCINNFN